MIAAPGLMLASSGSFSFKEQVMVDDGRSSLSLIRVQLPAFLLVFFDSFANLLVMPNLHTDPFFQFSHLVAYSEEHCFKI
jgi:hypothetical protein